MKIAETEADSKEHAASEAGSRLAEQDRLSSVGCDKAYDSSAIRQKIASMGAKAVIPQRANRLIVLEFDSELYKNRNLIERFYGRLKQFRRVATRYDKLAMRYSSFIAIAAIFIRLSR